MTITVPCSCCKKMVVRQVKEVNRVLKRNGNLYCSFECEQKYKAFLKRKKVFCANCNKEFVVTVSVAKKSKSGNHFCCCSCSAIFNNKRRKWDNQVKEKISKGLNQHYRKSDRLYWIETNDKKGDWFVISSSMEKAINFHNLIEKNKYKISEIEAIEIKCVRKNYREDGDGESYYAVIEILERLKFKVISDNPVDVYYKGWHFKEGVGRVKVRKPRRRRTSLEWAIKKLVC